MADFYNIKVADIYKETEDTSVVTFDIPTELREVFKFTQGQHLTLKADINGEDVRRSYSLCSCPMDNQWQVAVKQIPEGKFSTYINEHLKAGDKVAVREKSKSIEAIERSLSNSSHVYEWITWNNDLKEGTFVSVPARLQIPENIKEQLIVELYNK